MHKITVTIWDEHETYEGDYVQSRHMFSIDADKVAAFREALMTDTEVLRIDHADIDAPGITHSWCYYPSEGGWTHHSGTHYWSSL